MIDRRISVAPMMDWTDWKILLRWINDLSRLGATVSPICLLYIVAATCDVCDGFGQSREKRRVDG